MRLVETFLDLVRIDSPSGDEAEVARYCADVFAGLGFEVRFDDSARHTGSNTGNLIAVLPPNAPGRTLVLSAHMDCVQPCRGVVPVLADGRITSAGETVLGADDKAGIAVILETVRRLIESGESHGELRVVLTVSEETGLTGAKALDPADVQGDLCLVLDADGEPGGIVTSAPTHYTFVATFHGTAAHAGVAPELGRSALVMASRGIAALKLGRLDERTTANIGTVEGGTATNVIPARATVTGECRSLDAERVEQVRQIMDTTLRQAAHAGGGTVDVAWTREYDGFCFDADDPAVDLVSDSCREAGVEPTTFPTGGGSDGNVFTALGVPTLVLACGMKDVHSTNESIRLTDLETLADIVTNVGRRMVGE